MVGRGQDGFTLLEILVAMMILSVGIVGALRVFTLSLRTGTQASRLGRATEIAQRELALISAAPGAAMGQTGSEGAYTWQTKQVDLPEGLVGVSVAVKWSQRGKPQTFALSQIATPGDHEDVE